jgi:hypothetical protein
LTSWREEELAFDSTLVDAIGRQGGEEGMRKEEGRKT